MAPSTSSNPFASLQIPPMDEELGYSRQSLPQGSTGPQASASASAYRPVSVAVHAPSPSQNPSSATSSSRRQQRASHTVVSPSTAQSQHHSLPHGQPREDTSLYTDVYSHPAAVAYAAAHPRRTIPKFGPYLLLQTLGEGEFGKVKLGLHSQWGEEVAVKLIRRGNVDSTVRMSKVEREIEVLRTLKHPNIVRLYDVIETDKYIGIILEYASGGELFDHILAHRYLRERDAAKLFSQLISGVWYIHQKKIVHRDLKLENLLLDRHRNVIITDFGFANRFEHRSDDLMQTSCGSPCYAAPELVISEGLYVGSAVDIWSCGVILYAMLAGYLPFDDDPANPDGDNINLLYKYIVNTPLSFPDYISAEARDLLSLMLVPDPTRRASLDTVMRHTWLAAYSGTLRTDGVPAAFGKCVVDLEKAAMEQHQQKRLAYQKQMKASTPANNLISPSSRSQSHRPEHATAVPSSSTRSRSTQPEYLYDSSLDQSISSPINNAVNTTPTQNGAARTFGSPAALGLSEEDPFAAPSSNLQTNNVVVTTTTTTTSATSKQRISEELARQNANTLSAEPKPSSSKGHRSSTSGGGGFRHTIQVEYDEPSSKSGRKSEDKKRDRSGSQGQTQLETTNGTPPLNGFAPNSPSSQTPTKERRPSQGNVKPLPPSPLPPASATPSSYRAPASPATPRDSSAASNSKSTAAKGSPTAPNKHANALFVTTGETPIVSISSPPPTPSFSLSSQQRDKETSSQTSGSSIKRGHKKGKSSIDKLGLGKIFGGSSFSGAPPSPALNGGGSAHSQRSHDGSTRVPSEGQGSASSVLLSPTAEREKEPEKGGKKSRRNTLTVMVEPFIGTIRNRKGRMASTPGMADASSVTSGGSKASQKSATPSIQHLQSAIVPSTTATTPTVPNSTESAVFVESHALGGEGVGMQASTGKARTVMQWFRTKSKGRDSVGLGGGTSQFNDEKGTPTQTKYKKGFSASSSTVNQTTASSGLGLNESAMSPVQVVVTQPQSAAGRAAPYPKASGHPQRSASSATDASAPGFVTRFRNSVTVGGISNQPSSSSSSKSHPHGQLRIHHGAVDQTTITTRAPPEVMAHVKDVLEGMGVEINLESQYKYRCIRAKKKKNTMTTSPTPGGSNLAAVTMSGSAASNGVDKRGLPVPSPSAFSGTGGMLRGLLMRRQSSQVSSTSQPSLAFDDETSVVVSEPLVMNEAVYGDPSQDAGDEVRFSVELTRLDRLNDTFSLDIRRLKGNLRSYKYLYDTLRQRANLQR